MNNRQSPGNSTIERALIAIEKLEAKLAAVERAKAEPIAIIGMGCRFPGGAKTPMGLWQVARAHENLVTEMPSERSGGRATSLDSASRWAGWLEDVDQFDAGFFGISPNEANDMDPQHRLLLEVAWEALENACLAPDRLQGSKTGVFIGTSSQDYWDLLVATELTPRPYLPTGNATSIAAGRLAHIFGFRGPCTTVQTACSSSLVALHMACQSLRRGECDMALVGGANVLLNLKISEQLEALQILSADGRCRTFDAKANGYVRAEGIGVVVLERLSDAQSRSDPISALIRGTAMNHNGRAASLTAPSVQAQTAVIRAALEDARLVPERVGYVEVHSNGSPLGDPIELEALKATIGKPRQDGSKCILGSVKTLIGHAEAASGMASLIKTVFVLRDGVVPPNLHFETLTPYASIEDSALVIPTSEMTWKRGEHPRIAGVSSTGLSGTNVHIVVEEPPQVIRAEGKPARPAHLMVLSAKNPEALFQRAGQMLQHLAAHGGQDLGDVCHTLGIGRSHFEHRFAVVCSSHADASGSLSDFVNSASSAYVVGDVGKGSMRKRIGLFLPAIGSGADNAMGPLETLPPVLQEALRRGDDTARGLLGRSVLANLDSGFAASEHVDAVEKEVTLFVIQYALIETWQAWGIEPSVVVGEGTGECVAAWAAGLLELQDAMALALARARAVIALDFNGLSRVLARAKHMAPRRTLIPGIKGQFNAASLMTAAYWERQIERHGADDAIGQLLSTQDLGAVVVCGVPAAAPVPSRLVPSTAAWVDSLRSGVPVIRSLLEGMATLYVGGYELRWEGIDAPHAYRRVTIPTYPFQRQRYWFVETPHSAQQPVSEGHPILGAQLPPRADRPDIRAWETKIEHSVRGRISIQRFAGVHAVTSGAIVSVANAAIREVVGERSFELTISIGDLPPIFDDEPVRMQVIATPEEDAKTSVEVFFRNRMEDRWTRVAHGRARFAELTDDEPAPPSMAPGRREGLPPGLWTHRIEMLGSDPKVFAVDQLLRRPDETFARGTIAKDRVAEVFAHAVAIMASMTHPAGHGRPWTIAAIDGLITQATNAAGRVWLRVNWSAHDILSGRANAEFVSDAGDVLAVAKGITLRAQDPVTLLRSVNKDPVVDAAIEFCWEQMPTSTSTVQPSRKWIVLGDVGGAGAQLAKQLEAAGDSVVVLAARGLESRVEQLDHVLANWGPFWGVIHLGGLDAPSNDACTASSLEDAFHSGALAPLKIVERLLCRENVPRLWLVTRGAQSVHGENLAIAQVGLWGLGRVLSLEYPDVWGGLIDLDPAAGHEESLLLAQTLRFSIAEDLVALRGSKQYVARFARFPLPSKDPLNIRPDCTYILSRALCPLGVDMARWLVARGARNLLLIEHPDVIAKRADQRKRINALEAEGAKISIVGGDTADADTMQAILYLAFDQVGGVIHINDGESAHQHRITSRDAMTAFREILRVTCLVPWTLHKLTAALNLDFFIMVSPMKATLGWEGYGADAIAVEYVDAITRDRRHRGGRATSVHMNFPTDTRVPQSDIEHEMLAAGIHGMPAAAIVPSVERLLANDVGVATVGWIDWDLFEQSHRARAGRPLLERVVTARRGISDPAHLRKRLTAAEPLEARRIIEDVILKEFERVLRYCPSDLFSNPNTLTSLGMDSIMVLQALAKIGIAMDVTLPVGILVDQPSADTLVHRIATILRPQDAKNGERSNSDPNGTHGGILVELASSGTKAPFFCAPPLTGSALWFQALAKHLGDERRFYGFNAPGIDTDASPCDKVEILASRFIEVMRQVAPKGPYRIGGFSFGAAIVYEMARMLVRSGERIDICVLIDPMGAVASNELARFATMSQIFRLDVDESTLFGRTRDEQISIMANRMGSLLGLPPELGESSRQLRLYRAHLYALLDYVPEPYDGAITLLRARGTVDLAASAGLFPGDVTFGWGSLCARGVYTHEIPGDHYTALIEPLAADAARVLRSVLDKSDLH